jgi:uncharacterized protein YdeI (YjbR/CyaY-like superfamily)
MELPKKLDTNLNWQQDIRALKQLYEEKKLIIDKYTKRDLTREYKEGLNVILEYAIDNQTQERIEREEKLIRKYKNKLIHKREDELGRKLSAEEKKNIQVPDDVKTKLTLEVKEKLKKELLDSALKG